MNRLTLNKPLSNPLFLHSSQALATSKHTLSVLLPKFNKMIAVTKVEGARDKIQDGLLDGIDEAMSDASEQMDNLATWLKESGFGDLAGTVMLAMRWKNKAFGSKKRGNHFGSIRISPTGQVGGSSGTFGEISVSSSGSGGGGEVASALADAKKEAMADMADLLKGDSGDGGGGGAGDPGATDVAADAPQT